MRGRHQRNWGERRRRRRGEHGKRRRGCDEGLPRDDSDSRAFFGTNLRALSKLDIATAPKDLVEYVRREKNIGDGVFDADGRLVSDRRVHGEPRRWGDQRQAKAVGERERLEKDIDVAIDVAARSRANVEHFNALGAPRWCERDSVDDERSGEVGENDFAALRGYR